jgi:DNA-binding IclR family transcriptional regulator
VKDPEDKNGAQAGIQVIARAASILRTLENHPDGLSLGQIAKSVDLARSTVQRMTAVDRRQKHVGVQQVSHSLSRRAQPARSRWSL